MTRVVLQLGSEFVSLHEEGEVMYGRAGLLIVSANQSHQPLVRAIIRSHDDDNLILRIENRPDKNYPR